MTMRIAQKTGKPDLGKPVNIGGLEVRNRAFLAPMSGVTDLPFRKLAWKYGAGLVISEMVASEAYVGGEAEMAFKADCEGLPLKIVQLAGCEQVWMSEAAKVVEAAGAQIIDINMGCPSKRVVNGQSGSALMRDLDHALTLIHAVVEAVSVPVTLKMRLGWDHQSMNAAELASRAEAAGIQMITVHARTRCQFYKGTADWNAIQAVRESTSLPLVVNGDIINPETAQTACEASEADVAMIGRGAYGAPWMPAYVAGVLNRSQVEKLIKDPARSIYHFEEMLSYYGIELGIRQARKHLSWYLDRLNLPPETETLRKDLLTATNHRMVQATLLQLYSSADGSYEAANGKIDPYEICAA